MHLFMRVAEGWLVADVFLGVSVVAAADRMLAEQGAAVFTTYIKPL